MDEVQPHTPCKETNITGIRRSVEEFGMQTSEEDHLVLAQFSDSGNDFNPTSSPKPISMVAFHQDKKDTSLSYKQKQTLPDHDKAKQCAKERAEEVQANLDPEFPSFVKIMLPSLVSSGFWLGFPSKFCSSHLPKKDVRMTLVDENQEEFSVKFLARKTGLSCGWKGFSIAHKLVEGDVLVFHLIKNTKFQVYIIRAYGLGGIDRVVKMDEVKPHTPCQEKDSTGVRRSSRVSTKTKVWFDYLHMPQRFSSKKITYKRHATERAEQLQSNCEFGQNLAEGAMHEVVRVADCVKASNLRTSRNDFMAWNNSLEAFGKLGGNVGFLRARVQQCMEIKAEAANDFKICGELRVEQARVKAELAELEKKSKIIDSNIKIYEAKSKENEVRFRSVVNSPW